MYQYHLPPFRPDRAFLEAVEAALVELPRDRRDRLIAAYGLSEGEADFLCDEFFGNRRRIVAAWKNEYGKERVQGWIRSFEKEHGDLGKDFYEEKPLDQS